MVKKQNIEEKELNLPNLKIRIKDWEEPIRVKENKREVKYENKDANK